MRKEELRRLRALPATKEMMFKGRQFQEIEEETWWNHKKRKVIMPEYDVLFRVQNLSGYIKVAVFLPEDIRKDIKNPRYEIFLNVEGEEYITRELDQDGKEVRWLSSMLENLPEVPGFGYWSNTKYFIGNDGMRTLNNLKLEHDSQKPSRGGYRLQKWQQEQKDKETKRKEDKEQKPWDEDMALIPKIMPGFKEWMRKEAAEQYYMIYEYDSRGAKTGYCSRCKRVVPISGAKHGEKTKCQACGVESIFKASGKIQTLSTGTYYGEVIQKFKGGIVIRGFEQRQWYRNRDYRDPYVRTKEYERIMIFDNGVIRRYEWDSYKNKYDRWILDKGYMPIDKRTYYWQTRIKLYKKNLSSLKRNTLLKRSAIDLWPDLPVSTTVYIAMEQGNPAIEMLARIGMFRLAKGIMKGFMEEYVEPEKDDRYFLGVTPNIYRLTGFRKFKSIRQKLAVNGTLNMPDGYTTLVALPTGGGKSLITQTMAYQKKDGLTITVVPTVSLAMDQVRVAKENINIASESEIACYYSDLAKEEKRSIIDRVKNRKLRLLFISPEKIITDYRCCSKGNGARIQRKLFAERGCCD